MPKASPLLIRRTPSHIATFMGKASKALTAFIKGIPDDKLKDIGESQHTIYQDTDFRLDMQGVSASFKLSSRFDSDFELF